MPITIPIAAPRFDLVGCDAGCGAGVGAGAGVGGVAAAAAAARRRAAARALELRELRVAISNLLRVLKNLPSLGRFWFYPRRTPFLRVPPSLA